MYIVLWHHFVKKKYKMANPVIRRFILTKPMHISHVKYKLAENVKKKKQYGNLSKIFLGSMYFL